MSGKPKFKPVITRVKLNPEQAVLSCTCFSEGYTQPSQGPARNNPAWTNIYRCYLNLFKPGATVRTADCTTNSGGMLVDRYPSSATSS